MKGIKSTTELQLTENTVVKIVLHHKMKNN